MEDVVHYHYHSTAPPLPRTLAVTRIPNSSRPPNCSSNDRGVEGGVMLLRETVMTERDSAEQTFEVIQELVDVVRALGLDAALPHVRERALVEDRVQLGPRSENFLERTTGCLVRRGRDPSQQSTKTSPRFQSNSSRSADA